MGIPFLEPPLFLGGDYVLRMNATQVQYLCALMGAIRKNNPVLFNDPNVAMVEAQLLHQAYVRNLMHGDEQQKSLAAQNLPGITAQIVGLKAELEAQASGQG